MTEGSLYPGSAPINLIFESISRSKEEMRRAEAQIHLTELEITRIEITLHNILDAKQIPDLESEVHHLELEMEKATMKKNNVEGILSRVENEVTRIERTIYNLSALS